MENRKLIGYVATLVGVVIFILSLVFFILSFGAEDYGEYGSEFWADADYALFMLIGIAFGLYGLYTIKNVNEPNAKFINSSIFILLFTGFIDLAYNFGRFFRTIAKGKGFDTWYFCFGFAGIVLFALGACLYFVTKNSKETN
ncbi:MAG: hypothetical protein K6F81_05360 [Acholeplasmatales bacterium]|nr:hypothetical protein [Acholeplasmatales bacterium]